jgi:hypothetical protein
MGGEVMDYKFDKSKPIEQTLREYKICIEEALCHLQRETDVVEFLLIWSF